MIYNGILWFCCLYISNIWWKFTSVNWGPSIAIRISLPRLMSLILDQRRFLIKWVWSNKCVPPRKKILYETLNSMPFDWNAAVPFDCSTILIFLVYCMPCTQNNIKSFIQWNISRQALRRSFWGWTIWSHPILSCLSVLIMMSVTKRSFIETSWIFVQVVSHYPRSV